MSKKALLVISFGTSAPEALRAIENIEQTCAAAYPDYDMFRVFTSGMIIRKLKRENHIEIEDLETALTRLAQEGYQEILCQPTHMIPGSEYDKMYEKLEEHAGAFQSIRAGAPLLSSQEDYERFCDIVAEEYQNLPDSYDALILVGHGSAHRANEVYPRVQEVFRSKGLDHVLVGTVEGEPDYEDVLEALRRIHVKKIAVMPMLVVAGVHVREDLTENDDSWKNLLRQEGYQVDVIMKGLGEIENVARRYTEHLRDADQLKKGKKNMRGKLYGIGVGPGDPEYMTLKAVRLIRECDVVAYPVKKPGEESVALNIARAAVEIPDEKIHEVVFLMNPDKKVREACRKEATEKVKGILDEGKDIAMLALGDIGIYSTYSYVHKELIKAGYDVQMVSGIPSFCAGASTANISIVEGNEGFGVIPSLKGIEEVKVALDTLDNLVIMKVGNDVKAVYDLLKERGMENNATIISNVGLEGEYVGPLDPDRSYGYFTTMVIKKEL